MKKILRTVVLMVMGAVMMVSFTGCGAKGNIAKAYKDYFPIGVAIGDGYLDAYDDLLPHFNSITAENEMKWGHIQPQRNVFNFTSADKIVAKAKQFGMKIRGHALVWHSSMPTYIYRKNDGTTPTSDEVLSDIRNHIDKTVKHFGEDIYCWDVVNEVISDGVEQYRESEFYKITGTAYIHEAFKAARAANPNIKLFYNDYEMINPVKRAKTVAMIKEMQDLGIPIDGVGMQAHYKITNFNAEEFEQGILDFAELGLEVQITELDFSIYDHDADTEKDSLSKEYAELQARCYGEAFRIMRKHADKITGVTLWGVADDHSWLDNYPVQDRKDYPLLFDGAQQPKPAYYAIMEF